MVKNDLRSLMAGILAAAFIAIPVYSQATDTSERPRNALKEMKDVFKRWLNEDVPYIITEAERDAFRRLTTDEERESFIATFWRLRDPDPDTEENEFREEYYERVAFANAHYSSGIPGWKTDRGRIYIRWGKPDSIESHPTGGAYDRPGYEGGGSTSTYPLEVWFYRNLETAGNGIEVEFVDPSGTGEYRIARNADEKDALAMVPNAGLKTREMLGIDPKANRLNGTNVSYQREQDSPFSRLNTLIGLETPPRVKYSDLDAMTRSEATVLNEDPIPVDHRIDFSDCQMGE